MRYCPDCRLQLPDEARHCPSCGRPLPTDGADAAYRNPYAAAPAEDAGSRYEGASLFSGDAPAGGGRARRRDEADPESEGHPARGGDEGHSGRAGREGRPLPAAGG